MNLYKSAALCLGLCLLHFQASAYTQHSDFNTGNPADNSETRENRLKQIYETQAIADNIWSGLTNEFVSAYEAGDYTKASAVAKKAYDIALTNFGKHHVNTLGNYEVAKQYMIDAMEILTEQLGPYHEDVAIVLTNLANLYFEQKMPEQSESYHKKALCLQEQALKLQ